MNRLTRKIIVAAFASGSVCGLGSEAKAGPFLDWLWGNRQAPVPVGAPQYLGQAPALAPGYQTQGYAVPNYQSSGYLAPVQTTTGYLAPAYQQSLPTYPQGVASQVAAPQIPTQQPVYPTQMVGPSPYSSQNVGANYGNVPVTGFPQTQVAHLPNVGYASQWNRAAVTNYRPVTSLDPVTGTTVTRMVPCTSYELQAQRIPVLSMRPALGNYYPQASRWPSLTAPSYGPTPVPSSVPVNPAVGYSTNYVPAYGAPLVQSAPLSPSGAYQLTPVYGNGVMQASANMPTTMAPTGNFAPSGTWPTSPSGTTLQPGSVPGTIPGTIQGGPVYVQPLPVNGNWNGPTYSSPSSSIVPSDSYPAGSYPGSSSILPEGGRSDQGWSAVPPGLAAPQGHQYTPYVEPGNSVEDPDSVVRPSIDRSRDSGMNSPSDASGLAVRGSDARSQDTGGLDARGMAQQNRQPNSFPMRSLARSSSNENVRNATPALDRSSPIAANPFPRGDDSASGALSLVEDTEVEERARTSVTIEPRPTELDSRQGNGLMEAPKPSSSLEFDGVRPIPAPPSMEAPRFNPSLLDARDRTASNPRENTRSNADAVQRVPSNRTSPGGVSEGNMRWISAEIDRPSSKDSRPSTNQVLKQPSKTSSSKPAQFGVRSSRGN